ncbi:MAG: hypothetical protein KBA31_16625 [Alphaproteobacteria bacterium]|nr:hypothetical protein [Alphaproteobacteria bacterium]
MRIALVLGAAALVLASAVQAADRKIDDFMGRWVGTGQATQGTAVTQSRDSEVIFEKAADGFKVSWTTMSSNVNEASKSKVKASELTFKKGKKPGVFVDVKSGAATEGKKTTWARLSGDTLSITQLVIGEDGQWDVTVYNRTLKGAEAMNLAFTRITNGAIARQASLEMSKAKD